MSALTSIEWTDRTWNPVRGCSMAKGSELGGCLNCYAARMAARGFSWSKGLARMTDNGPRWTGVVRLVPELLDEPFRWRDPQRVFVNSMSDLFHESLPDEAIDQVFAGMVIGWWHTYQILTKRSRRMRDYFAGEPRARWVRVLQRWAAREDKLGAYVRRAGWPTLNPEVGGDPLDHVWLGVSVESADHLGRVDDLKDVPAAVRFVSFEPLLADLGGLVLDGIHWAIFGGESGPGARPCDVQWIRSGVRQCRDQGVAPFVKQMGRWVLGDGDGFDVDHWLLPDGRAFVPPIIGPSAWKRPAGAIGFSLADRKGGDMSAWPVDLRVRQFPRL